MYCRYVAWCIGKCLLYRGVLYSFIRKCSAHMGKIDINYHSSTGRLLASTSKDGFVYFWTWNTENCTFKYTCTCTCTHVYIYTYTCTYYIPVTHCTLSLITPHTPSNTPIKYMEKNRVGDQTLCSAFSPGQSVPSPFHGTSTTKFSIFCNQAVSIL